MIHKQPYWRTRTKSARQDPAFNCIKWRTGYLPEAPSIYATYHGHTGYDSMTDRVTPNFKRIVQRGGIVANPMVAVSHEVFSSPASAYCNSHTSGSAAWQDWYQNICPGVDEPTSLPAYSDLLTSLPEKPTGLELFDSTNPYIITANEAYARVNDSAAHVLVTFGEALKTLSMLQARITDSLQALTSPRSAIERKVKGMRKVRVIGPGKARLKTRSIDPRKVLNDGSGLFLEWRLGWKPLLKDIEDLRASIDWMTNHPIRVTGRSARSGSITTTDSKVGTGVCWATGVTFNRTVDTVDQTLNWHLRCGVLAEVRCATASRGLGSGWYDIPGSAWELVPYSFVVDRLLHVGDWLAAWVARPEIDFLTSWYSLKWDVTQSLTHSKLPYFGQTGTKSSSYGSAIGKQVHVRKGKQRLLGATPGLVPGWDTSKFFQLDNLVEEFALAWKAKKARFLRV